MITTNDINALIAFSIQNNKFGTIKAMNLSGYQVPSTISDSDLFDKVQDVFKSNGLTGLKQVLNQVPLNKSKISQEEAKNLFFTYNAVPVDPNAKFGDFLQQLGSGIGDFLSGHTTVTQGGGSTTSTSTLSSGTLALTVLAGLISIIIFRKFTAVVIAIVVLVLGVIAYGIFSRNITQTGASTSTSSYGGALGWVKGILNGLNLSIVGG